MENSILTLIKKLLGIGESDEAFDIDVILGINTAFMILNQIGIGPKEGFSIEDKTATWNDFLDDRKDLEAVKTFVFLNTRLGFDPPQNSFLVSSINDQIKELTWRLLIQGEPIKEELDEGGETDG